MAIGALVLALLMGLIVSDVVASHMARQTLRAHSAHWAAVARQIPIGASREQVGRWARRSLPPRPGIDRPDLYPAPGTLAFAAETLPEPGLKFPCAAWSLVIAVRFDANGHVVDRRVNEVGVCV